MLFGVAAGYRAHGGKCVWFKLKGCHAKRSYPGDAGGVAGFRPGRTRFELFSSARPST